MLTHQNKNFQLLQMVVVIRTSFHLSFILKQIGLVFAFQDYDCYSVVLDCVYCETCWLLQDLKNLKTIGLWE